MVFRQNYMYDGDPRPDRIDPRVCVSEGERIRHEGHAEELDGGGDGEQVQLGANLEERLPDGKI